MPPTTDEFGANKRSEDNVLDFPKESLNGRHTKRQKQEQEQKQSRDLPMSAEGEYTSEPKTSSSSSERNSRSTRHKTSIETQHPSRRAKQKATRHSGNKNSHDIDLERHKQNPFHANIKTSTSRAKYHGLENKKAGDHGRELDDSQDDSAQETSSETPSEQTQSSRRRSHPSAKRKRDLISNGTADSTDYQSDITEEKGSQLFRTTTKSGSITYKPQREHLKKQAKTTRSARSPEIDPARRPMDELTVEGLAMERPGSDAQAEGRADRGSISTDK